MQTFVVSKKTKLDFKFIVNDEEKIESIYINLNDDKLPDRLRTAESAMKKRFSEIETKKYDINSDVDLNKIIDFDKAVELDDGEVEKIQKTLNGINEFSDEINNICIEELSKTFDTDISPAFKYCKPFDIINNDYYVYLFLKVIADEFVSNAKKEAKAAQKSISKKPYMKKYMNERSVKYSRK